MSPLRDSCHETSAFVNNNNAECSDRKFRIVTVIIAFRVGSVIIWARFRRAMDGVLDRERRVVIRDESE